MLNLKRLETDEQAELVRVLRKARLLCFSIPNGAKLAGSARDRALLMQKLKREGLLVGAPDLLLINPPPARLDLIGTLIEMKRVGITEATDKQNKVHVQMQQHGWFVVVASGCADALRQLRAVGYLV